MFSIIRIRTPFALLALTPTPIHLRHFAFQAKQDDPATSEDSDWKHPDDLPLRPAHGIPIDHENHGLSAFYRKFFQEKTGKWDWTAIDPKDDGQAHSGRSWSAPELRRKSFKDLHTLWYVLLRERNLLATQKEEMRRLGVSHIPRLSDVPWRMHQCRKSMARIKYVINERRLAYEGAVELFTKDKALGRIGATAEQETAQVKSKGKKVAKPATTIRMSGKYKVNHRPTPTRTKLRSGKVPVATTVASATE